MPDSMCPDGNLNVLYLGYKGINVRYFVEITRYAQTESGVCLEATVRRKHVDGRWFKRKLTGKH